MKLNQVLALSIWISGILFLRDGVGQSRLQFNQTAGKLSSSAKVSDWLRFNGPNDDACSPETNLLLDWSEEEPKLVWALEKGDGYSSPAISQNILVLFHRMDGQEMIEARNAENGRLLWDYSYPVEYRDRYGYLNGPRASPVIIDDLVYAHGVTAWITCLELRTGKVVWRRNLREEFGIPQNFFGKGSNPISAGGCLIINLGGSENRSVVGLDFKTGLTKWVLKDEWGASYSSPRRAKINDKEVCLVFAGGEGRPSTGGLIVLDPKNGRKLSRFPWRSKSYESVNAVPPIPLPENRVYLSECYEKGSVVLSFDKSFQPRIEWENPDLNIHWMTPVLKGDLLYGISGRHQRGANLYCVNHLNGKVLWKEPVTWSDEWDGRRFQLELFRGSLLAVGKEGNDFIGLSELGSLITLKLNHETWRLVSKKQLFFASGTWTMPALSRGLLYIMQNELDRITGNGPRLLCYDLRKQK